MPQHGQANHNTLLNTTHAAARARQLHRPWVEVPSHLGNTLPVLPARRSPPRVSCHTHSLRGSSFNKQPTKSPGQTQRREGEKEGGQAAVTCLVALPTARADGRREGGGLWRAWKPLPHCWASGFLTMHVPYPLQPWAWGPSARGPSAPPGPPTAGWAGE